MLRSNRTPPGWKRWVTVAALAVGLSACIDPEGEYNDFLERAGANEVMDAGPAGECPPLGDTPLPDPAQLSGTYYYVVSLTPYTTQPTIYLLEVMAARDAGGDYTIMMRNRPLLYADRKTPTGEFSEWSTTTVSPQGCYTLADQMTVTPGNANVLTFDVSTTLDFSGNVGQAMYESGPGTPVKFFCGTVTGVVTAPIAQDTGGTFTATRVDPNNPSTFPATPVIDCAMTPAGAP
ncbi:MAG: hypothetical protein QM778_10815 [Myxococcales bacterium]